MDLQGLIKWPNILQTISLAIYIVSAFSLIVLKPAGKRVATSGNRHASLITFWIFLIFLASAAVSLLLNPPPEPLNTYQSNSDVPNFSTTITWDNPITAERSISIAMTLQPKGQSQLAQRFGPAYTFYIGAQLDTSSSTFSVDPKEQMQQPIQQGVLSFHWIATPLHAGDQAVDVIIKGIWVPQKSGDKPIAYYLGSHVWHISVNEEPSPWVTFGPINVNSLLGAMTAVMLSTSTWEFIKKWREERKAKPKTNRVQSPH